MGNSINLLGSSLKYLQERINVISNNISNSDTAGFKKDEVIGKSFNNIFADEMDKFLPEAEERYGKGVLQYKPGVFVEDIYTKFAQGLLEETGKMSDVAISGEGFFTVDTNEGELYTRCLQLKTDSEGYLTTLAGQRIAGTNGFIQVGENPYKIDTKGNVIVEDRIAGSLKIVDFSDTTRLIKRGENLFFNSGGSGNITGSYGQVLQGQKETSNVDLADEVTSMMEVARLFETNQKVIQMLDEISGIASNQIGKVR